MSACSAGRAPMPRWSRARASALRIVAMSASERVSGATRSVAKVMVPSKGCADGRKRKKKEKKRTVF